MLLLLIACTTSAPPYHDVEPADKVGVAATPQRVRVLLNWYAEPEFGGYYQALAEGLYAARGLDVTVTPGLPGAPVLEMVAAGQAEVAVSGADDVLARRAKGMDIVGVFPGFQHTPIGLMTHTGGPARYEDVTGNVAIEAGSPFQRFLWQKYGWEGKVNPVPTTGSIGAFAADPSLVQQAYITSEPCQAKEAGLVTGFLPGRDAGWDAYNSLVVVRGADKELPWVADFIGASRLGWESYLKDPAKANAEIAKINPDMTEIRMRCIAEAQRPFVIGTDGLGVMTEARWAATATTLVSVGQDVKPDGAFYVPKPRSPLP